jgi:hypothetical protein
MTREGELSHGYATSNFLSHGKQPVCEKYGNPQMIVEFRVEIL